MPITSSITGLKARPTLFPRPFHIGPWRFNWEWPGNGARPEPISYCLMHEAKLLLKNLVESLAMSDYFQIMMRRISLIPRSLVK